MKKLLVMFLMFSAVLAGNVVLADAAPNFKAYQVEVVNPEGTLVYNTDWEETRELKETGEKFAFGEILETFFYWYDHNGNDEEDYINVWNDSTSGYILKSDIKIIKDNLKVSDYGLYADSDYTWRVVEEQGINIYEWPGKAYEVIGTIPFETIGHGKDAYEVQSWLYISYNGMNGWIYKGDVAFPSDNSIITLWTGNSFKDCNGTEIGKIPANTVFKDDVWYRSHYGEHGHIERMYISYNGKLGYVVADDVAFDDKRNDEYTINYDGAIFITSDGEVIDIPDNTSLKYTYNTNRDWMDDYVYCDSWLFVNYNNQDGWVYAPWSYEAGKYDSLNYFLMGQDLKSEMVQDNYGGEELHTYYTHDDVLKYLAEVKKEVEDSTKNGFIDNKTNISGEENVISGERDNLSGEKTNSGENLIKDDIPQQSSNEIILISILCAIIVSVTAIVVIILINKNKNMKN